MPFFFGDGVGAPGAAPGGRGRVKVVVNVVDEKADLCAVKPLTTTAEAGNVPPDKSPIDSAISAMNPATTPGDANLSSNTLGSLFGRSTIVKPISTEATS